MMHESMNIKFKPGFFLKNIAPLPPNFHRLATHETDKISIVIYI